jgi:chromosome segregation protein
MFLEKLEIHGFKSFADKNRLVFPGLLENERRGLTSIVGPNGSGKSNIADAVRWVLGEQSTKTLRGKKSEDVIFSGSDKKSKLGMAEVSLYLNNSDKSFFANKLTPAILKTPEDKEDKNTDSEDSVPTEEDKMAAENDYRASESIDKIFMESSEIVITRRLYRDGDSEYLINNKRVRLSDIQMLLARASFGQKTYSVIGQGMVENFLNTSPAERKNFFDEATGVKQYQIKRDLSLNKLEGSQENLGQVNLLLAEIEPRLKSLTRQVEKLKKRAGLEEQLKGLQSDYYRQSWHEINSKLVKSNEQYLALEKLKREQEQKLEVAAAVLSELSSQPAVSEEFYELQKRFAAVQERRGYALKQLERLETWKEIKAEAGGDASADVWLEKNKQALSDLEKVNNDIAAAQKLLIEAADVKNKEQDLNDWKNESEILTKERQRLEAWLEMKLESQGQFDLSFLNSKRTELAREQEEIGAEMKQLDLELEDKARKSGEQQEEKKRLAEKISALNQELQKLNSRAGNKDGAAINERLERSLRRLIEAEQEADIQKIKEILKEIRVEINLIIKLSSGRGEEDNINRIQEELSVQTMAREELLENLQELNLTIRGQQERRRLLEDRSRRLSRELVETEKKLEQGQEKFDAAATKEQLADLAKKIVALNAKIEPVRAEISRQRLEREAQRERLFGLQRRAQDLEREAASAQRQAGELKLNAAKQEMRLEDLTAAILKYRQHPALEKLDKDGWEKERQAAQAAASKLETEAGQLDQKIKHFSTEQEDKRRRLVEAQKSVHELQIEISRLSQDLNELKINSTRQETRLEDLEQNIRLQELDLAAIKNTPPDKIIDLDKARPEIERLKQQLENIGGIDPETEKEYDDTKVRYDFLFGQTDDLSRTIKSMEKIIAELDLTIKDRFDAEFKVISEKFNEYFKILFGGGNAKISRLFEASVGDQAGEETETAFDKTMKKIKYLKKYNATGLTGIEIEATPPGKKISSIAMLSGGERALTAIALICAIISANPAPFVMLDEVDAALDESNSERLAKILDDLSGETQFIVITHNRALMRRANVLYGVTMQADGVSQLLSMKLEDVKSAR